MFGMRLLPWFFMILMLNFACTETKPTASVYKEKLTESPPQTSSNPKPDTTAGTDKASEKTTMDSTKNPAPNPAVSGNAETGLSILTATCETDMCHKTAVPLTKTTVVDSTTASKASHAGVKPVFTETNIADINAALAKR